MKGKILVTGGAGFIGSHTAVELLEAGYGVAIVDDLSNAEDFIPGRIEQITGKKVDFYRHDCRDTDFLKELFSREKFSAVIHFAASKAVGESVEKPLEYYENNLGSLLCVVRAMRDCGVSNLVFSSSATVYGQPDELPATEESPRQAATSPYGNTKQIAEDILSDCCRAYPDFNVIALRYFNPIGAHPSGLIGELPRGVPNNLVPFITQTAAGIRGELSVFGDDYDTLDGTCLRDYIDITDLAAAHVCAMGRMVEDRMAGNYEVFNIGTGRPVSVLELVETFERVNNVAVPHRIAPRREGDVTAVWADVDLANRELGWRAQRTLEETLSSAWRWQLNIPGK